jgi:ankyrin repeat protein
VHVCNLFGYDALQAASENGHLAVVRFFVEDCGADVHAWNEYALRWASFYGRLEVVQYLVEKGADVHAENEDALRYASLYGHLEVVQFLVEKGADVHAQGESGDALGLASGNGQLAVVKYLVETGKADVHALDKGTLQCASMCGYVEVVKYLESKGAWQPME